MDRQKITKYIHVFLLTFGFFLVYMSLKDKNFSNMSIEILSAAIGISTYIFIKGTIQLSIKCNKLIEIRH